jgi:hypothetical protein
MDEKTTLDVSTRTPVAGLPAWVTPEVVSGGFDTGAAVAGGPLTADEAETVARKGLAASRAALFADALTEPGLAQLQELLDNRCYRVDVPEEAALLTVAWLARQEGAGDLVRELLAVLEPFADRLRFTPVPVPTVDRDPPTVDRDPSIVERETVGEVRAELARRPADQRVAAMNEALTVWNPFADELLTLWLQTCVDGRVGVAFAPGWLTSGAALLVRYQVLVATHTLCTKHRKPKENSAILRTSLEIVARGGELSPRQHRLLQHAVDAMVRRRGVPGDAAHAALRAVQAADAARPTHAALAGIVDERLDGLPQSSGICDVAPLIAPVVLPDGTTAAVPSGIRRMLTRATAGRLDELVDAGVIGSFEVLARLASNIVADHSAAAYHDPALRVLMARHCKAFRNRRVVVLVRNFRSQVSIGELPWVSAVAGFRTVDDAYRAEMAQLLRTVGSQALSGFPGTSLPNLLVREFTVLSGIAALNLPWVEELAADIFKGAFSAKFLDAAECAGRLLAGSLYEDYYGIDYGALPALEEAGRQSVGGVQTWPAFDALCRRRAALPRRREGLLDRNGMVIEQAQILTTHNLATLATAGVVPVGGWTGAAHHAFERVLVLTEKLIRVPRPLPAIKEIAYAWRHMLFYAALLSNDEQAELRDWLRGATAESGESVSRILEPVLAGLDDVMNGEHFAADGSSTNGRRLLGWSATGHWLLPRLSTRP